MTSGQESDRAKERNSKPILERRGYKYPSLARLLKLFSDWRKNGIRYLEKQFFSDNYPWIG